MVDVDRLCYVHTPGMGKEEALEGQVKWAVHIFPVNKAHFKGQRVESLGKF
jgi:hypothetical protein